MSKKEIEELIIDYDNNEKSLSLEKKYISKFIEKFHPLTNEERKRLDKDFDKISKEIKMVINYEKPTRDIPPVNVNDLEYETLSGVKNNGENRKVNFKRHYYNWKNKVTELEDKKIKKREYEDMIWNTGLELDSSIKDLDRSKIDYSKLSSKNLSFVQDLIKENAMLRAQLAEKDKQLAEKDKQLAEKDKQLAEKDKQLAEQKQQLAEKDKQLAEKDKQLAEQKEHIIYCHNKINELEEEIIFLNEEIVKYKNLLDKDVSYTKDFIKEGRKVIKIKKELDLQENKNKGISR